MNIFAIDTIIPFLYVVAELLLNMKKKKRKKNTKNKQKNKQISPSLNKGISSLANGVGHKRFSAIVCRIDSRKVLFVRNLIGCGSVEASVYCLGRSLINDHRLGIRYDTYRKLVNF